MKKYLSLLLIGASFAVASHSALAADIIEAPIVDIVEPIEVVETSGWYIRGDVGYSMNGKLSADYVTYGAVGGSNTLDGKLGKNFSGGVGVGYQMTDYLRADLTADYFTSAKFTGSTTGGPCLIGAVSITNCVSKDEDAYSALSAMANVYVDLGTYNRVTPYVGAGFGITNIKWKGLRNSECDAANPASCNTPVQHTGGQGWRASAAIMAGASVDITCNLKADVGYRYRATSGGRMFAFAGSAGPGYNKALKSHEVRAGLRWAIGGKHCGGQPVAYQEPAPQYVNPPVYK